ncbi:MAG: hypothetical protein LBB66_11145, partial [Desulfovibrio sp.]|nr:hypothetical protein [Desulfovibrio sp.]
MEMEKREKRPQCAAKCKGTGERCKLKAEPGKRVCRFHGGKSTGPPKGSRNALKTGAAETLIESTMTPEERRLFASTPTDPLTALRENLRILKV